MRIQPFQYYDPDGIDQIISNDAADLIIRTSGGAVKRSQKSAQQGSTSAWTLITTDLSRSIGSLSLYKRSLLLVNAQNGIYGYDTENWEIVLSEILPARRRTLTMVSSDRDEFLATIDDNCELNFYHFSNDLWMGCRSCSDIASWTLLNYLLSSEYGRIWVKRQLLITSSVIGSKMKLCRVGVRRDAPSLSSPVCVHERPWIADQLVGMRPEVVSLSLNEVGWKHGL